MNSYFLSYFEVDSQGCAYRGGGFSFPHVRIPVRNGIPRFTPDHSYSSGNFGKLREEHATLQLDSRNRTSDRRDTILSRTNWDKEFFKGRLVLECGCGAGPDTEILLAFGARVIAVDIAGVDVAKKNIGDNPDVQFVQASITDLPLRKNAFDIVFCHRVLQHTPDPEATLSHILQFVKEDGAAFVHSYAPSQRRINTWKYFLRPVTKRMNPGLLYALIKLYARPAYRLTNCLNRSYTGRRIVRKYIPFSNKRGQKAFDAKDDEFFVEYGVHDTFDSLSPKYDNSIDPDAIERIAKQSLKRPFELIRRPTITLLRTVLKKDSDSCAAS